MSAHDKLIIALTENKLSQKPRRVVMIRACGCVYYDGGSSGFRTSAGSVYLYEALLRTERCKTAFHRHIMPERLWRVDVEEGAIALFHLVPRS